MPMTLIEGHYEVIGAAPDGDSVRFYPRERADWELVRSSRPIRSNQRGGAQLRLDGVDALETHYSAMGHELGVLHQPLHEAQSAAANLLQWIGFRRVERDAKEKVVSAQPARTPGYILTRFADAYGRCVAFAFEGKHPGKTGDQVYLDRSLLEESINYRLLSEGLAYPTYYSKLYFELRRAMTRAVVEAREAGRGIWERDRTTAGWMVAATLEQVQEEAFVLPKLFRRLVDYFALGAGDTSLAGFPEYLAQRDDRVFVLSEGQITNFDTVVETRGQTLRLLTSVEDLVFQEK
ncbi:MAG TPA: thermonuclease family protein [Polyangiaceae bacterium]|nr:thermonuclease family protein [Polyangiaceae bacterium]